MKKLILPNGSGQYGAQLGRPDALPADRNAVVKLKLTQLKWVDGDYDQWGAYWGGGSGDFVFCAWNEDVQVFVRAMFSAGARGMVLDILPNAEFLEGVDL